MPSEKPTRLRRTPLGGGAGPPQALVERGLIPTTPITIGAGGEVEGGSSNPAATAATARSRYDDRASPPKPESPRVNEKSPFANLRSK